MWTWVKSLLFSSVAVFAPIQASMTMAAVLIAADLVVGIWAAHKRAEKLSSSGLRRTVTKILVYESAIMLGFLTETYMLGGYLPVARLITAMIAGVELKSILESLDEINGTPIFATVITKLGSSNDTRKDQK